MDRNRLNEVIAALNKKQVNQPCPRCSSNNFSVVGESEIAVITRTDSLPRHALGLGGPVKTTIPVIIVTCDNCGYVAQHAKATLGLLAPKTSFGLGLGGFGLGGK